MYGPTTYVQYEGSFSRWRHGRINYFYFKWCFIEFMAKDTVCHVCIFDRLCELLPLPPSLWLALSPFPVWISIQYTVLTIYVPEALLRCPLLCWCIPFRIFERCLELNPENCRNKQARNQLSHPSPQGFWFLITRLPNLSMKIVIYLRIFLYPSLSALA